MPFCIVLHFASLLLDQSGLIICKVLLDIPMKNSNKHWILDFIKKEKKLKKQLPALNCQTW